MSRRPRQSDAFTLIEVLAATAMVATLAGSLYVSLGVAFKASSSAYAAVENVRKMDQVMDYIKADLESAILTKELLAGTFTGGPSNSLAGYQTDDLKYYSTGMDSDPPLGINGTSDMRQIEYLCQELPDTPDPALVRLSSKPDMMYTQIPQPKTEILCHGVNSFLLRYFDGTAWQDTWDSTLVGDALPLAVEVNVELKGVDGKPGYKGTRIILLPCASVTDIIPASSLGGGL